MATINSYDEWLTAERIVKRIFGEDVKKHAAKVFVENVASQPDFPPHGYYGKTKKIWCWGEVSDYFRSTQVTVAPEIKAKGGKPRRQAA